MIQTAAPRAGCARVSNAATEALFTNGDVFPAGGGHELRIADRRYAYCYAPLPRSAILDIDLDRHPVELESGVYREPALAGARRMPLDLTLPGTPTVVFDDEAAEAYGRILQSTGVSRRRILDRMIAPQVIVHRATLVTRNGTEFLDVPGLALLDW